MRLNSMYTVDSANDEEKIQLKPQRPMKKSIAFLGHHLMELTDPQKDYKTAGKKAQECTSLLALHHMFHNVAVTKSTSPASKRKMRSSKYPTLQKPTRQSDCMTSCQGRCMICLHCWSASHPVTQGLPLAVFPAVTKQSG